MAAGLPMGAVDLSQPQHGLVQSHLPKGASKEQQFASMISSGWAFSCIITAVWIIKHFYHSSSREPHPALVHSVRANPLLSARLQWKSRDGAGTFLEPFLFRSAPG